MNIASQNIYFLGIGGIGMSAIARYYLQSGAIVGGYDRTETPLTRQLSLEGAHIHYDDNVALIGASFLDPSTTLVIYTPALPNDHSELTWFIDNGFRIVKRSQILGVLAENKYVMAVAGTHGKTTTTTMVAWLNHVAGGGGSAFLGGISKNFDNNFVYGAGDRLAVEADEFDRSFLQLHPNVAVITSADADHLDIYGTHDELRRTFVQFTNQIRKGGSLIIKKGTNLEITNPDITIYSYQYSGDADFKAENISVDTDGTYRFDVVCPDRTITNCHLGIPGRINVENAIAAIASLWAAGNLNESKLREALYTFKGVKRRFDFYINTPELIYMDDYAHHPEELRAALTSVREMFPGRKITAIFQPHLYSRTNDFYKEFAESLSIADEVILTPIYPAREKPIEGVSSQMICDFITVPHKLVELNKIAAEIGNRELNILISFGAGDIENCINDIALRLQAK